MTLPPGFGQAVADILLNNPWQQAVDVSLAGMAPADVAATLDDVVNACRSSGVALKGIAVDAGLIARPANPPFQNAWFRHGELIVADVNMNDAMVVRRA